MNEKANELENFTRNEFKLKDRKIELQKIEILK
jgi:hypothetical protein